jgi:zinc/manganese transport system ATP-binding protein
LGDRLTVGVALRLRDVTVSYGRHPAVHHVSGEFDSGSLTAIVGPNGAGKTTLLKAMTGLLPLESGKIESSGSAAIAYLPQQAALDRSFPISVLEVVLLGQWRRTGPFRRISQIQIREARRALSTVGLGGFEERGVATLSAGQLQRALFARVLVQDAPVILLDEPFAAVDRRTTEDLIKLFERWHCETRTVVAVLHDREQVKAHFPAALYLARECLAWGPTAEVVTDANERRAREMAEAWREDADACERR